MHIGNVLRIVTTGYSTAGLRRSPTTSVFSIIWSVWSPYGPPIIALTLGSGGVK